jgi:poly-beta-1,6-N-acetyl-D-glucosamine synthase
MPKHKLLIITPAKNEAEYIGTTIASMLAQTIHPSEWIIVDDGSTDATAEIAVTAARQHEWIRVLKRKSTEGRRVGTATVEALAEALAYTRVPDYDYLCIIDADLKFSPGYLAEILGEFANNPRLGIAAGQIFDVAPNGQLLRMRAAAEMTAGALKCWRRKCFTDIGGLVNNPGWDGIDSYAAMMHGWETRTFDREPAKVIHLRRMGSSDRSIFHGRLRRGRSSYFMGSHPLWMVASAAYHVSDRPYCLASIFTLAGYFQAMLSRYPQLTDVRLRRFIQTRQLRTLASLIGVFGRRRPGEAQP